MSFLSELFDVQGKNVIITGAARGNGKEMSLSFAKAGSIVTLCDVLEEELKTTIKEIKKLGGSSNYFVTDLSIPNNIDKFIRFIKDTLDHVDVLVNNAGISLSHHAIDYPEEYWDKTYNINLKAVYRLSTMIAKQMKNRGGSIINITSLSAEKSFPENIAYVTFKAGLKQFSKALALDLAKFNIRVNNIGPGYIRTNMTLKSWNDDKMNQERKNRTMLGRWGKPIDLVGAVIFLASEASSYITAQDIYVDGGWLSKGL